MGTHREALHRLRELEAQTAAARADLGDALQDQIDHGVKVTYLSSDTGVSRQTIYKYLNEAKARRDQGKACESLAAAA